MADVTFSSRLDGDRAERRIAPGERALTEAEALVEATRCLYCFDAPCSRGCPASVDVPEFIHSIRTRAYKAAARLVLAANALGESCGCVCPTAILCAGDCVLPQLDGQRPIAIHRLQRFVTRWARENEVELFSPAPPSGRSVALVGAGPASLACAHELTRLGHQAVLFEGRSLPGGLNAMAIAPHKMHADVPLRELDWLLRRGAEIHTDVQVGADITFSQMEQDYDAVFLGVGLGADGVLGVPGEDGAAPVLGAIALLEGLKTGSIATPLPWKRVLCVGGGNTAIDVVRTLTDLEVSEVVLVYRRAEDQMKGYHHEWEAAKLGGVETHFLTQPVEVLADTEGRVRGLRCIRMAPGELDASGRPSPVPVPGSAHEVPGDAVVMALGQAGPRSLLPGLPGDITLEGRRIAVEPETGATSRPGWYAGGDCANGGREVVNAAAEGMRAARAIDRFLAGQPADTRKGA